MFKIEKKKPSDTTGVGLKDMFRIGEKPTDTPDITTVGVRDVIPKPKKANRFKIDLANKGTKGKDNEYV